MASKRDISHYTQPINVLTDKYFGEGYDRERSSVRSVVEGAFIKALGGPNNALVIKRADHYVRLFYCRHSKEEDRKAVQYST